jgi:triacylglycerol lipase
MDIKQLLEKTLGWKTDIENPDTDILVILCHGWRSGPAKIKHLADFLKKNGFSVYRLNLSTTFGAVSTILKQVDQQLKSINFGEDYKKIHFIGHSFGGIITKIILNTYKFKNSDKYITLGTPWGGTSLSRKIEANITFGHDPALLGNGIKLLKVALAKRMANPHIKVGLIGGDKPYKESIPLDDGEKWDGMVPAKSALDLNENVVDRKVVHLNHSGLINDTLTGKMILNFFKRGKF